MWNSLVLIIVLAWGGSAVALVALVWPTLKAHGLRSRAEPGRGAEAAPGEPPAPDDGQGSLAQEPLGEPHAGG